MPHPPAHLNCSEPTFHPDEPQRKYKDSIITLSSSIISNICKQWVDEEDDRDDKREGDKDKVRQQGCLNVLEN